MVGKIVSISPDVQNTTIDIANKDSLTFNVNVVKETEINLADFINKNINDIAVCSRFANLCSLHPDSIATGVITKVYIGNTERNDKVILSQIYSQGIKYYIAPKPSTPQTP